MATQQNRPKLKRARCKGEPVRKRPRLAHDPAREQQKATRTKYCCVIAIAPDPDRAAELEDLLDKARIIFAYRGKQLDACMETIGHDCDSVDSDMEQPAAQVSFWVNVAPDHLEAFNGALAAMLADSGIEYEDIDYFS